MTRRVEFRLAINVAINETDLALLRLLGERCSSVPGPVFLTVRVIAGELAFSRATIHRSCRALVDKGLVVTQGSWRDDGGRGANSYEVTRLGFEVLGSQGVMRPPRPR